MCEELLAKVRDVEVKNPGEEGGVAEAVGQVQGYS